MLDDFQSIQVFPVENMESIVVFKTNLKHHKEDEISMVHTL